jgi:pimeloyl-ACP methyl ester carboxylesterase
LRERFRVIALDQRGHGDSGLPHGEGFAWRHVAEDTYGVIRALGIEGCYAAGHSAGGTASAVCAGQHPGSISRLLLIDPVLRTNPDEYSANPRNSLAEGARRRRNIWESPDEFEARLRSRPAFARWRPEFITAYAQHGLRRRADGRYELKCAPELEATVFEEATRNDPWPAIARLTVPSILLRATGGVGPTPALDAASRIPHCREIPVAASHFIPMEAPEAVLAAVNDIFAR